MAAYSIVLGTNVDPVAIEAVNAFRGPDEQVGSDPTAWTLGELIVFLYESPDDRTEVVSIEVTP